MGQWKISFQHTHCKKIVQIRSFYGFICMMEKVNFGYSIKNIPILITINGKSWYGNHMNEIESNTFQQQQQRYR